MKGLLLLLLMFACNVCFPQSEYYLTSGDGTRLCINANGSGKSLILLAGGPGLNATYLQGIVDSVSLHYNCIVPDGRGTGKSVLKTVDSASLTMDRYLDDLEILRKHLNLEKLTLVGHSWGGMLAMEYASKYPERIEKMVLLAPGGPTTKFFAYFNDNIMSRLHEEDVAELHHLNSVKQPALAAMIPGYFFNRQRGLAFKKVMMSNPVFGQEGVSKYTMASYVADEGRRLKALGNYKGPVYIIQGRQDPIGESTDYEIKDYLPQTQIYFIEKSGHMPWLEDPEPVKNFFMLLNKLLG